MAAKVGRKRQSPIWDYFQYECEANRSKCLAVEGGKVCGAYIKGKNPTNLKVHLKGYHKQANLAFLEKVMENVQPPETVNPRPGSSRMDVATTVGQQTLHQCFHRRPDNWWLVNSQEHHKREEALVQMFIETGISTRLCEATSFRRFTTSLEPKFKTPGAARVNGLIGAKMEDAKQKLKGIISEARKLTICVDGWSKRGLTASFMGVSACFYYPPGGQVHHALLNLHRMEHPHTGETIARCIDQTLEAWGIGDDQVLLSFPNSVCCILR